MSSKRDVVVISFKAPRCMLEQLHYVSSIYGVSSSEIIRECVRNTNLPALCEDILKVKRGL